MRLARALSVTLVLAICTAATIVACGGDDDDDDGNGNNNTPDAFVYMDAKVFMDAPPTMGIGQPCMPEMTGSGQGDCPAGFQCLTLTGGAGSWCTKSCTRGSGDQCSVGYTGPGFAMCLYDITFGTDPTTYPFCGVVCNDTSGACTTCNGQCPGALQCTVPLGTNGEAGSACK
jgi:hypothetical protein